jgi:hypothetical protein
MWTLDLPWETWRAIIAALARKGLPYILEHADWLESRLEQHGPADPTVRLSLTDDVYLGSVNWPGWNLG